MRLRINGEIKEFESEIKNISELLKALNVNSKFVAVELNGSVVYKESFETTEVKDGDKLEIVSFVGGG